MHLQERWLLGLFCIRVVKTHVLLITLMMAEFHHSISLSLSYWSTLQWSPHLCYWKHLCFYYYDSSECLQWKN